MARSFTNFQFLILQFFIQAIILSEQVEHFSPGGMRLDIPMFMQGLFGADPEASRWASRLQPSCEPQVKVAGNRCLLLPPGRTE